MDGLIRDTDIKFLFQVNLFASFHPQVEELLFGMAGMIMEILLIVEFTSLSLLIKKAIVLKQVKSQCLENSFIFND
jgi:hypothetical protein